VKQANLGLDVEQLINRQSWLQASARQLLEELRVLSILEPAGTVRAVGSLELGLMVWPDIDLEIVTSGPPEAEAVLDILRDLVVVSGVQKINYADHRQSPGDGIPRGVYLGPDIEYRGVQWQVDLWFVDADQAATRKRLADSFRKALDDHSRRTILEIKQVAAASDKYHRGISSVDIYRAVLEEKAESVDDFVAYLARSGREL